MDQWLQIVGDVGFPILVTFYLLNRVEGKLDVLIQSIQMLPSELKELRG